MKDMGFDFVSSVELLNDSGEEEGMPQLCPRFRGGGDGTDTDPLGDKDRNPCFG